MPSPIADRRAPAVLQTAAGDGSSVVYSVPKPKSGVHPHRPIIVRRASSQLSANNAGEYSMSQIHVHPPNLITDGPAYTAKSVHKKLDFKIDFYYFLNCELFCRCPIWTVILGVLLLLSMIALGFTYFYFFYMKKSSTELMTANNIIHIREITSKFADSSNNSLTANSSYDICFTPACVLTGLFSI
jgi:hypothetical protein